ncbi:sugar phosphate nucleotidyltransferase [Mechercharimyces sp. CAU 1602]|uniref:sugar phosphate nucleotidyltransferase n=1 Tax=Mechercharimyces sp. CAU 1602 TaxID=2973933 RepID=UPI0021622077|nr:sugar phosphate nucleotidyltransferase [Mechercharimyces sp. CAU 1602]MCS1350157.1 sugar phosphate nucleotidyltransferase [Mechercharimyces sp. CAU 1602]
MDAVIMTGGKGTRLAPYTKVLPKGLLPIGDYPILEILIRQLRMYGFTRITMCCGYLASLVQTYFQDGEHWGVSIRYHTEQRPLGTAGPLKELMHLTSPFLLLNCDVLTNLDFRAFRNHHVEQGNIFTVASQEQQVPIHLGVLETKGNLVTGFKEKPNQSARVSMGIYMMNPELLSYIPDCTFYDIPDLIQDVLKKEKPVHQYPSQAFWLDIGRPEDLYAANRLYPKIEDDLFSNKEKKSMRDVKVADVKRGCCDEGDDDFRNKT